MMKTILTYGTFDLFHIGHLNILERLSAMGDRLIVGVSTDEFNALKGKNSLFSYEERARIVGAINCVDMVIPEISWDQKRQDIERYSVDLLGIGEDWRGRFDNLANLCDVCYLPRTSAISSTKLKQRISGLNESKISEMVSGLDDLMEIAKALK